MLLEFDIEVFCYLFAFWKLLLKLKLKLFFLISQWSAYLFSSIVFHSLEKLYSRDLINNQKPLLFAKMNSVKKNCSTDSFVHVTRVIPGDAGRNKIGCLCIRLDTVTGVTTALLSGAWHGRYGESMQLS